MGATGGRDFRQPGHIVAVRVQPLGPNIPSDQRSVHAKGHFHAVFEVSIRSDSFSTVRDYNPGSFLFNPGISEYSGINPGIIPK